MKRLLLTLALLVAASSLVGAQTYLMDVDGVDGSSTLAGYEGSNGWMVIEAVAFAGYRASADRTSPVQHQPFQVYMLADPKSYPKLIEKFIGGAPIPKIDIHSVGFLSSANSKPLPFVTFELKNVTILEASSEGSSGDSVFLNLSLSPEEVKITSVLYNPDGSKKGQVLTSYITTTPDP